MYDRLTRSLVAELFAFCTELYLLDFSFAKSNERSCYSLSTLQRFVRGVVLFLCCYYCVLSCLTIFLAPP